jgi:hypothetical protein
MQFRFKNIDWKSPKVLWGLLIVLLPEIIIGIIFIVSLL